MFVSGCFGVPCRRHLEEVQERVTVKRQRSDRSLEDVKETHISLDLKAKKLTQDLEAYTAVLGKLTSADRQEKDPSASWSCHFNDLLQQDLTDAPLLFSDSQLPYLDMIVELSKHISCLTKEKNKVEHSAARALKVFNAKCQSHQKTVNRLKRKVEKVFHGNTEETLEKNKRLHTVESDFGWIHPPPGMPTLFHVRLHLFLCMCGGSELWCAHPGERKNKNNSVPC